MDNRKGQKDKYKTHLETKSNIKMCIESKREFKAKLRSYCVKAEHQSNDNI